ncbi:MAG: tetratricopeptide repeat-containing protein, partial [Flavobacterium sp.]
TKKLELINRAREVIRGSELLDIQDLKQLCKDLEANDQFAYATEVLLLIIEHEEKAGHTFSLKNYQTLAKYIYKDHSLPSSFKFDKALNELKTHDDLLTTGKCESLGLAGAIYKRKWMVDHQFRNLILSQHYYKRGFDRWKFFITEKSENRVPDNDSNDDGYNAINYAYINDLMAIDRLEQFSLTIGLTEDVLENLSEARKTRDYIIAQLAVDSDTPEIKQHLQGIPWVLATIAEAYFGLYQYDKALQFINQYIRLSEINRWETRSFNQQIFSLGYLQLTLKKIYDTQIANKNKDYEQLR